MELSFFVGVIGNIISVLFFLSPVKTFWRVLKNRSTEEFDSLPYISTILSTSLWNYYGFIKPDVLIITITTFGVSIEITYLIIFLIFASPKARAKAIILVAILDVGFGGGTILISLATLHGNTRTSLIGFLCAGLNIINCASPLAISRKVVTTKSVEYMPFLLTFCIFVNSGVWTFYALLIKDPFIGVPNLVGFILGTMQLILYAIYMKGSQSSKISTLPPQITDDHHSLHEHLLSTPSNTTASVLKS